MCDVLKKIQWSPQQRIVSNVETISTETDISWLKLSNIFEGLFVTCEETICNRFFAQENGISLILTLNGSDYVAPYRVYEYSSDLQRCVYNKLSSFDAFVTQIDHYMSNEIPEEIQLRKVFIRSVSAEDSPVYDISRHFSELCTLIELVMLSRKKFKNCPSSLHAVVVHCLVGVSRSVSVVMAYIMKRTGCSKDEALLLVKNARPVANPNPGFHSQLLYWEEGGFYRVVDSLTASLTANELRQDGVLGTYMEKYFPLLIRVNRFVCDREFFALVIAEAGLGEDSIRYVLEKVYSYIAFSIADELYVDIPAFFDNICETIASFARFLPILFVHTEERTGYYFDDLLYYEFCKNLASVGGTDKSFIIVKAFCSFFEAIGSKHFLNNPGGRPQTLDSFGKVVGTPYEELSLTFPFLPFVAPFAAGFVPQQQLEALGKEKWTTQMMERNLSDLLSLFQENFLLTTFKTGLSSDTFSTVGRWHANSRLLFLESDMEVKVLESVERGSTLSDAVSPYLHLDHLDQNFCLTWMRKVTGAVIGTRFFYEAVDRYFNAQFRDSIPDDTAYLMADKFAPWEEIFKIIQSAGELYAKKCGGESSALLAWIREELRPLVSIGVVSIPSP
ncbi:putative dual specificity protein phosphatase [Trypanosoma cruzi]|uniref:Dual specificity protein phosphatase, putative n=2 Tax=Trypanosoma cruzi TaxID=5693 RepID=Q4CNG9_TRYCC|nr:dual specificity protein phosphatase, putative [Trypanosoma cruzi]EAN81821.1 dual specificity protein phosphatase, putative [Trypanosoma cruzi]PWV19412.1 putative dual specificity protein phosphatase [Trypanosoma cruzi]|eukprot:XP_803267.1 dual specificity protein phosphatase [Trypanosoma cruzi strain CL Brener]